MTAAEIIAQLQKLYPAPSWAFFTELANGTGANARRRADAVAFDLWPSRGLQIVGFEIKRSRRDWLAERNRPWKADAVGGYCDEWWLVVMPDVLKDQDMVPPLWGVLEVRDDKLVLVTKARPLRPRDLDRAFVAALLRRACEHVPAAQLAAEREKGYFEGSRQAEARESEELDRLKRDRDEAKLRLAQLGGKLGSNDPEYVGAALRLLRQLSPGKLSVIAEKADRIGADAVRVANAAHELGKLLKTTREVPPGEQTTRPMGFGQE